jgi:hypothetical protein
VLAELDSQLGHSAIGRATAPAGRPGEAIPRIRRHRFASAVSELDRV